MATLPNTAEMGSLTTRANDPMPGEVVEVSEHFVTVRVRINFGLTPVRVQYPRAAFAWGEGEMPLYFIGGEKAIWSGYDPDPIPHPISIPLSEEDSIKALLARGHEMKEPPR